MSDERPPTPARLPRELADGLQLRHAVPGDRDALGDLLAAVHAAPDGSPNAAVRRWQRDLFDKGHPTIGADDMFVVQDRHGELVSSFLMVPQTWSYAGVPLGVGLLELAATRPDHRGYGLSKIQLNALLEASTRRGDLIQGITDILSFRGDTGLLPAITQRAGRGGYLRDLPVATGGEPVAPRPATVDDIAFLMDTEARAMSRGLLACVRDEVHWRHELGGRSADSMVHSDILIIEMATGPVGYVVLGYGGTPSFPIPSWLPGLPCPEPAVSIARFELRPGVSWFEVVPSVLRQLTLPGQESPESYLLWLGREHPAYEVLGDLLVRRPPEIGWFLRVPDAPALLRAIAPVLEQRLIGTAAEAFTGEIRIDLYRYGIRLSFDNGILRAVERWPGHSRRASDASLPEQMFHQIVFGHATWDELARAFPDSRLQTTRGSVLLPLLFPVQSSDIWPLI
ncbi:GNAT family N-acetyltransferase [Nocardia sp. NBC_00416]|uniref:GNAT family N-acetyltransferase n=1 Tax=Nocardia sp. NBC_00416 TaxID=2975991 RepID=UPI002E22463B